MSYLKKDDEEFVTCPFNKSHKVKESSIQYHITRCMKNYPGYEVCPFNATHRFKPKDMVQHITECPSQAIVQHLLTMPKITGSRTRQHGDLRETPIHVGNADFNKEDEDWDADLGLK